MQQLPAVQARQHHVENDQVIFNGLDETPTGHAVVGHIHRVAGFAQALGQRLGDFRLVFH
ncbi:hypothetical protein D3C78_1915380 [compost metagenome]